jgi:tetratricopeptide (TPR) repeat protein
MMTENLKREPQNASYHSDLGIALAGLGRKQEAIQKGLEAVDLQPASKDAIDGFSHVEALARIYTMVGEYDEAIRRLQYLMSIPGVLGIGALRLDPAWKPLHHKAEFQALLRKVSG